MVVQGLPQEFQWLERTYNIAKKRLHSALPLTVLGTLERNSLLK